MDGPAFKEGPSTQTLHRLRRRHIAVDGDLLEVVGERELIGLTPLTKFEDGQHSFQKGLS